jgi:hypothetical protein
MLGGLNALELTSQYTSYWRVKSITEDLKKGSATVVLICIRQPDRHGKMGAAVCLWCLLRRSNVLADAFVGASKKLFCAGHFMSMARV